MKNRGRIGRGVLLGSIGGALAGFTLGFIAGDNLLRTPSEGLWSTQLDYGIGTTNKTAGNVIVGTISGGIIGGLIAIISKKSSPNGSKRKHKGYFISQNFLKGFKQ